MLKCGQMRIPQQNKSLPFANHVWNQEFLFKIDSALGPNFWNKKHLYIHRFWIFTETRRFPVKVIILSFLVHLSSSSSPLFSPLATGPAVSPTVSCPGRVQLRLAGAQRGNVSTRPAGSAHHTRGNEVWWRTGKWFLSSPLPLHPAQRSRMPSGSIVERWEFYMKTLQMFESNVIVQ